MRRIMPHRIDITRRAAFFHSSTYSHHRSLRFTREAIVQQVWKRSISAPDATKRLRRTTRTNTTTGILRRSSTARKALRLRHSASRPHCTAPHRRQSQSNLGYSQSTAIINPQQLLRMRRRSIAMFLTSTPSIRRQTYAP